MQDFKKLSVWRKAHAQALLVYHMTQRFPKAERYALTSQLRSSAVSVVANIAEGCGQRSQPEKAHFFQIAVGSASELECYLLIARDLGLLEQSSFDRLADEVLAVRKMLGGLLRRVRVGNGRRQSSQKWVGGRTTPAANSDT